LASAQQHPQASQIERFGPARISAGPGGRTPVSWPPFHRCCFSTSRRQRDLDFNAVPGLFLSRINHDAIIDETSQQRRRRPPPPPPPPPHLLNRTTVGEGNQPQCCAPRSSSPLQAMRPTVDLPLRLCANTGPTNPCGMRLPLPVEQTCRQCGTRLSTHRASAKSSPLMPPSPDTAVTQRQQPVPILLLLVQEAIFCLIAGSPSGWASTIKPGTPEWLLYNRAPSSPITLSQANAIFSAQSRCFQKSGTPPRRSSPLAWQLSNGRNFPRLLNNETALSIFRFYISTKPIACVFAVPPQASGADSRAAAHCRRQPTPFEIPTGPRKVWRPFCFAL
jgi:hypothetical protein